MIVVLLCGVTVTLASIAAVTLALGLLHAMSEDRSPGYVVGIAALVCVVATITGGCALQVAMKMASRPVCAEASP